MKKIPTLFRRDPQNLKRVLNEVDPDCQWVLDGEGLPTEKFDGSACLVRKGIFYKRHQLKRERGPLEGWLHWDFDSEAQSGHGWLPVRNGPEDRYHREALGDPRFLAEGTYELVGPKLLGNPYGLTKHTLWEHGRPVSCASRDFDSIRAWLAENAMEGIVWHHPDGRMAKIKRRDFGLPWPPGKNR